MASDDAGDEREQVGLPPFTAGAILSVRAQVETGTLFVLVGEFGTYTAKRLFVRRFAESRYRELVVSAGDIVSAAISSNTDDAFVNIWKLSSRQGVGVFRYVAQTGAFEILPDPWIEGAHGHVWIADIVGSSERSPIVVFGQMPPSDKGGQVEYGVARLSITTGELVRLSAVGFFGA